MLCCEKVVSDRPEPSATEKIPSTNGNGGGAKGLRRNRNVRFTDLKGLAEESDDEAAALVAVGPLQNGGAAKRNGAGPVTWTDADEDLSTAVVVTFEQGGGTDDEGTSVTSRDGTLVTEQRAPAAAGTDGGDAFKEPDDPKDAEVGCCMQCAYFIVEFCGCSIM